jgi:hypothetical protein
MRLDPLCLAVLLSEALPAQAPTHISPVAAATSLGDSNNSIPFSWTPTAYQQVHSLSSFSSTAPAVLTSLNFRMASGFINRAGRTIDVEIFMSESPNDAPSASGTFANNVVAATEVNVFPRAMVALPQVPDNSWVIAPFAPFAAPFVFIGQAHISWRAIVWGNSNNNSIFSYPLDAWSPSGTTGNTGSVTAGCQSANGGTRTATMTNGVPILGSHLGFSGNSYVPTGGLPALLAIGSSASAFFGIPLPFDLTAAGAPGCFLYNNWLDVQVGTTQASASGDVTISLAMPNDPSLAGAQFYSQYLFAQPGANPLGVFATQGRFLRFGSPPGLTRIYASGVPNATSGTVGTNYGMAIGLN